MADALFTINADSSDHGYDAAANDLLTLRLKTLPPSGVQSVRFQVWDASDFDPEADAIANPPQKAKDSPSLSLVGATTGTSVSPAAIDGTVTVQLPATTYHAWIVRCVVNGGMSTLPDGRVVFDATLVHERMIVIRDSSDSRPVVATETTQYDDTNGWAPEIKPGASVPTGTDTGYLSRAIYVDPSSPRVGTTWLGYTLQAAVTWTTAADVPDGKWFEIQLGGGGGGGAGGGGPAADGISGAGGGGGARRVIVLSRAEVLAMLPLTIVCGTGGAGGIGKTTVNLVVTVTPTAGGTGSASSFGSFSAGGGSGGSISTGLHGGLGGGIATAPAPAASVNALAGGMPAFVAGTAGFYLEGAGRVASATATDGNPAVYGGASGGAFNSATENAGGDGGRSVYGGGGGGAGRAANNTVGAGATGSTGGGRWTTVTSSGGGGAGGPGTNGAGPPVAAADVADSTALHLNGNGGGGGGSNDGNTSPSMTAGNGGKGGFPGGAGGGGGATRLVAAAARTFVHGNGGGGADGCVIVTAYA